MSILRLIAIVICVLSVPVADAKNPKTSAVSRDGSSKQRAIIVEQPYATYVRWEYQYLAAQFPNYKFMEHALIPESRDSDRGHDLFVIMWRGQKKEVWFDISKPFQEFTKKHPE